MNCVRCIVNLWSHFAVVFSCTDVSDWQTKATISASSMNDTLRILTVSWTVVPHLLFLHPPKRLCYYVNTPISDIFSVKEWCDLENQVRGRSRSLKMAPFDRAHATFYWSAIVNIALSCTIFEFFLTLNNIVTLKSGLEVTHCNVIEIGAIRKLGCRVLFAFYSNYGRICSSAWD